MMRALTAEDLRTIRQVALELQDHWRSVAEKHDPDCLSSRYARVLIGLMDADEVLVIGDDGVVGFQL